MLREQTAPKNSGFRTSLPSILDNWAVFKELLDEILKWRVDKEVWFQVTCVNANAKLRKQLGVLTPVNCKIMF